MKVIMTGGGTGGHIYPAVAIADKIKRKHPEAEILFVGTEHGMEKDLVPSRGYPIRFITVSGFNRKQLWKNVKTVKDVLQGSKESKEILRKFEPDLVIGTGGYVCGPVVRAAHKMGIPTFIHEQNALPGMTNKMLEPHVKYVFAAFEEAKAHFKQPEKFVVTGNPIRREFQTGSLMNYRERLGIGDSEFAVLCVGGSLGAGKINEIMKKVVPELYQAEGMRLFYITGKNYYDRMKEYFNGKGLETQGGRLTLLPYSNRIHEYIFASDLVISRAGALTVSELTACGKPSILIPSPNVTGNHQYYNAKAVADKGGAVLIEEKDLAPLKLTGAVLRLMGNRQSLNAMGEAATALGRIDAADVIYDYLGI